MNLTTEQVKTATWILWVAVLLHHPFIALYFLPTVLAKTRDHNKPLLVIALNICFGWTPCYFLVLVYALEKPNKPNAKVRRAIERIKMAPIKFNITTTTKKKPVITI